MKTNLFRLKIRVQTFVANRVVVKSPWRVFHCQTVPKREMINCKEVVFVRLSQKCPVGDTINLDKIFLCFSFEHEWVAMSHYGATHPAFSHPFFLLQVYLSYLGHMIRWGLFVRSKVSWKSNLHVKHTLQWSHTDVLKCFLMFWCRLIF